MFSFVGGERFGPVANASTPSVPEKHIALAARFGGRPPPNTSAWHPAVREFYSAALPKPELVWFEPGCFHVAVHVRRGDVNYGRHPSRFLTDGLVARCVLTALAQLPRGAHVHIFSQGREQDFVGPLRKLPRVRFHLNGRLQTTFHHMVHADALVMAASTLSDTAAFLNFGRGGRIFAHPAAKGLLKYMHRDIVIHSC